MRPTCIQCTCGTHSAANCVQANAHATIMAPHQLLRRVMQRGHSQFTVRPRRVPPSHNHPTLRLLLLLQPLQSLSSSSDYIQRIAWVVVQVVLYVLLPRSYASEGCFRVVCWEPECLVCYCGRCADEDEVSAAAAAYTDGVRLQHVEQQRTRRR
jgi:hypothetical protein